MNIIYIFGITILLMRGTDSFIEDAKSDNNIRQKILLRKLQNFQPEQEAKPSTWNEVLADVLVNKIQIFSFKNQDKEDVIKEDTVAAATEKAALANFFSNLFIFYKKFIYDAFVGGHPEYDAVNVTPAIPNGNDNENKVEFKRESEDVVTPPDVTFETGPKSEVELLEPKYHGKITLEEVTPTQDPGHEDSGPRKRDYNNDQVDTVNSELLTSTELVSNDVGDTKYNINVKESVSCGEGFVKSESGNCIKNNSRLIMAVPYQCPIGYRLDFLGNCRKIFRF